MRIKIISSGIIVIVCLLAAKGMLPVSAVDATHEAGLRLTIVPSQRSFTLGEPVQLKIELENDGSKVINPGCFAVETGNPRIFVGQSRDDLKKYSHSQWGISDTKCGNLALKPQDKIEIRTSLLWNFIPSVANVDRISREQLTSSYAFPKSGVYLVKAKYSVNLAENVVEVSSEPVEVVIEQPVGEDLEVWNKIKDNGDIAYLIQEGSLPGSYSYQASKRVQFEREVEQLVSQYPDSAIAGRLKERLRSLRVSQEKSEKRIH